MKLFFDQICRLTAGAVSIEEDSAGIHFQRYTPEQLAAFEKEARCFYKRGVTLKMDARAVFLNGNSTGSQPADLVEE